MTADFRWRTDKYTRYHYMPLTRIKNDESWAIVLDGDTFVVREAAWSGWTETNKKWLTERLKKKFVKFLFTGYAKWMGSKHA